MSSLHAYVLDSTNSNIALVRKLSILYDVAKGLVYLHSHKPAIIHRDLTGNNVLLDSELYGLLGGQARTCICVQSVRQTWGGLGDAPPGNLQFGGICDFSHKHNFPGPAQLFVACSTIKRGEPGIFSHVSMT